MSAAVSFNAIDAPGGPPTLSLNDSATATYDANASHLSAGLLVFDYTVSAHDYTTDLAVTAFHQNGTTIADAGGNVADFATGFPFAAGIGINSFNSWKAGKVGDWSTTSDWTSGNPGPTTQATILSGGVVSSTASDNPTVGSIATAKGATLDVTGGTFTATLGTGIDVNAGAIVVNNGATLTLGGGFVNNGSVALSGTSSPTRLELDGVSISGGKLQTSGASARIETVSGTKNAVNGATIVSGSVVAVVSASTLTLSGGTIGAGATVSATSGTTAIISGLVTDAGTLAWNGATSVGVSATLETLTGGTALLGGAVTNSGTLFASGAHSLVDILSGAVVTGGGIAKVGNGVVNISAAADAEDVVFLAGGTGGLELADAPGHTSAFAGHVSGFGQNVHQFIDLTAVAFTSGAVSASYSSSTASSGVLTVTSGGSANVVAVIDFIGHYVTSNFHVTSGAGGTVEIFDPPLAGEPPAATGHSANLALFANYLAASFPAAVGYGGVLITETLAQAGLQPLLAHPHTG
jgi:fibronectin-binding autotransporter adhesin